MRVNGIHPNKTANNIDGYMQAFMVLLNIFTGSVAAQCLFHGLNRGMS
ncbi:MAG: hypothetical protein KTR20_13175 [Cellvibrionaceae bacterium]|nr:hypothetical protein [Cellvibrionaceae bacterium]